MHLDCYVYACFVQAHSHTACLIIDHTLSCLVLCKLLYCFPLAAFSVVLGTVVDWLIDWIILACENNVQFFTVCNTYNVKLIHYDTTCAYIPYIGMAHTEGIAELYVQIDGVQWCSWRIWRTVYSWNIIYRFTPQSCAWEEPDHPSTSPLSKRLATMTSPWTWSQVTPGCRIDTIHISVY